jgi:hypothetical protein
MAKRRKRRSQKSFDVRLAKDLRAKRIVFLRELSEMVSNAIGIRIRCSFAGGDVVVPQPTKPKRGKVARRTAHVAGYQEDPKPEHEAAPPGPDLPEDTWT